MDRDLLHPTLEHERQSHKLKRLVPAPNSYFMDVKCGGCNETAVVFSHAQTVVACNNCKNILSKPTGGKCKLTEGSAFKVKAWFCLPYLIYHIIHFHSSIHSYFSFNIKYPHKPLQSYKT